MCEPAPHCIRWHEVDEGPLAVDLHHRQQLAIPSLELGVAVDQDLVELEAELVPEPRNGLARTLAEVAPLRAVQPDLDYG